MRVELHVSPSYNREPLAGPPRERRFRRTSTFFFLEHATARDRRGNYRRRTGRFDRRIYFPDLSLNKDKPKVSYINGILRIAFTFAPVVERIIPVQ